MNALDWVAVACAVCLFGPVTGHAIHRVVTGRRPSAAEVARAEQIAATPAHPAGKAIPEPAPFDAEEWERRYAAAQAPAPRRHP